MSRNAQEQVLRLAQLTRMLRETELSELNRLTREVTALKSRIDALSQSRNAAPLKPDEWPDPARASGQDMRFHTWAMRRMEELNSELASARSAQEAQVLAARRAFGKNSILEQLVGKSTG